MTPSPRDMNVPPHVRLATTDDLQQLVRVAALTFPLACPPSLQPASIAAFIEEHLSAERFAEYLADPTRVTIVAVVEEPDEKIVGYAMLRKGTMDDPNAAKCSQPAVELSKIFVLVNHHGDGTSDKLITAALKQAIKIDARSIWLGVNQNNQRAIRFYTRHKFEKVGTKTFRVGNQLENDFIMERCLDIL
jgi:ribosomal protein S18 acetylase RimI-like enzyme